MEKRTAQEIFEQYGFHNDRRSDRDFWLETYFSDPDPSVIEPISPTTDSIEELAEKLTIDDENIQSELIRQIIS